MQITRFISVIFRVGIMVGLAAWLATPAMSQEKEGDPESLKVVLSELSNGLADGSPEKQVEALKKILPTKSDVQILFPDAADLLWPVMEKRYEMMFQHINKVAAEVTSGKLIAINTYSLREPKDVSHRLFSDVLALLPDNIPVYRVTRKTEQRTSGSSAYLKLRGRWIHFQGLEAIPETIKALKEREK